MYGPTRFLLLAAFTAGLFSALRLLIAFSPWSWVAAVVWVLVRLSRGRARQLWSHGTAKWCGIKEMKKNGMLSGTGMILGRVDTDRPSILHSGIGLLGIWRSAHACRAFLASLRLLNTESRLVRMPPSTIHTVIFAPSGAGKNCSLLFPMLLDRNDNNSAVVVDFKAENFRETADARRSNGGRVFVLDPYGIASRRPSKLNPISFIDPDSDRALEDCKELAQAIVVRKGTENDPYWNNAAELFISAAIAVTVCEAPRKERTLQCVRNILADPGRLQEATKRMIKSERWGGLLARTGAQLLHPKERELGSIISNANTHTQFLDSLAIAESLSRSSFNPAMLRTQKTTIYLCIPFDRAANTGLLRLWVSSIIRACVRQGLQKGSRVVNLVLDEAAALGGQMPCLGDLVEKYRGYALRGTFAYQSMAQLIECWSLDRGQKLLGNASAVFFGVNDLQTATEVSNRLGERTIIVAGGGRSTGSSHTSPDGGMSPGSYGTSSGENSSWSAIGRKLLKPEEVLQLHARTAITFVPGMATIATTLIHHAHIHISLIRRVLAGAKIFIIAALVFLVAVSLALCVGSMPTSALDEPGQINPKRNADVPQVFGVKGGNR